MFRRKRASSNPPRPSTTSTSAAATTAASQAFLANRASNANLSSAAAAAALRSHTSSPIPVGQLQTKRMQRRGSIASNTITSGNASARPGGLQRRDSGSSMTERTFREPSPNRPERPASSHGPYPRYDHEDAPPVPALPKTYTSIQPHRQVSSRRPASVEPLERMSSPPPRSGGRGVSLDRGHGVMPSFRAVKTKPTLDCVGEVEPAGNRVSVNFSRPMSPQNIPSPASVTGSRPQDPQLPQSLAATRAAQKFSSVLAQPLQDTGKFPIVEGPATAVRKKKKKWASDAARETQTEGQTDKGGPNVKIPISLLQAQVSATPSSAFYTQDTVDPTLRPRMRKKQQQQQKQRQDTLETQNPMSKQSQSHSDTESISSDRSSTNENPRTIHTRAAHLLAKQPSVVREEREPEEQADTLESTSTSKSSVRAIGSSTIPTAANTSKTVIKDRQHSRSASQPTNQRTIASAPTLKVPGNERPSSLSPARAAHFSSEPVHESVKHQPPGRSVSPAKSALKYSPSRGHSPGLLRRSIVSSDTSESTSQLSDDGQQSYAKKKKSVRVSFDENTVAVGHDAEASVTVDPSGEPQSRSWLDFVHEQRVEDTAASRDSSGDITPTPLLPTFGSIRKSDREASSKATAETLPSSEWARETLQGINKSTEAPIGQEMQTDQPQMDRDKAAKGFPEYAMTDPVISDMNPSQKNGHNFKESRASDVDSTIPSSAQASHERDADSRLKETQNHSMIRHDGLKEAAQDTALSLPSISIEPATPGINEVLDQKQSWPGVPGSFPLVAGSHNEAPQDEMPQSTQTPSSTGSPSERTKEHDSGILISPMDRPDQNPTRSDVHTNSKPQHMPEGSEDEDEVSDGDSIYSDAAEDQSDLDGDGFGSINAIVDSPSRSDVLAPQSTRLTNNTEDVHTTTQNTLISATTIPDNDTPEPGPAEGWDRAQAYWSGLSQTRKQQLEQAALPGAIEETPLKNRTMRGSEAVSKKKKQKVRKTVPPALSAKAPTNLAPPASFADTEKQAGASSQSLGNPKPRLRTSMRTSMPPALPSQSDIYHGQISPPTKSTKVSSKSTRPVSAIAMVDYNKAHTKGVSTHTRINSASDLPSQSVSRLVQAQPKALAHTQPLNRVASDSSFKKARATSPENNRYTMKRSMRGQSTDSHASSLATTRAGTLAARASSPTGSLARRPFTPMGSSGVSLRTSMRDAGDKQKSARVSVSQTLRSSHNNRSKSPSRFSFGRASKAQARDLKTSSRFSSRFGDSSDDEAGIPTASSSRFADSSSEDEPSALTPVRGIPRRIDEGDSTDLEDSSVDNGQHNEGMAVGRDRGASNVSLEKTAIATGKPMVESGSVIDHKAMGSGFQAKKTAEKDKKKRSFFGTLSRKRDDAQTADISVLSARRENHNKPMPVGGVSATRQFQELTPGPSSPRQDTTSRVETNSGIHSNTSIARSSPKSPKLQRRVTPKRITSTNNIAWPLPQNGTGTPGVDTHRPRTSDGPSQRSSPRSQRGDLPDASDWLTPRTTASLMSSKKKRFPMLRKAFGLHD